MVRAGLALVLAVSSLGAACASTPKTLIPVDSPIKQWAPRPEVAALQTEPPEAAPAPAPAAPAAPATADPAKPR